VPFFNRNSSGIPKRKSFQDMISARLFRPVKDTPPFAMLASLLQPLQAYAVAHFASHPEDVPVMSRILSLSGILDRAEEWPSG
jgi:hypothetical protein